MQAPFSWWLPCHSKTLHSNFVSWASLTPHELPGLLMNTPEWRYICTSPHYHQPPPPFTLSKMPKAVPPRNKPKARSEPYPTAFADVIRSVFQRAHERAKAPWTEGKENELRGVFRFCDLPNEIKLLIYGIFSALPPLSSRSELPRGHLLRTKILKHQREDRKLVATTRKSLLSVSHQISDEWVPIYYRAATIMVNPDKRLSKAKGPTSQEWARHPEDFASIFLKTLPEYKIKHIRLLAFDATLWIRSFLNPATKRSSGSDFSGMHRLVTVLREHGHILESLETLEVSLVNDQSFFYPGSSAFTDYELAFRQMDHTGNWQTLIDRLTVGCRGGVLQGWSVQEAMVLGPTVLTSNRALARQWDSLAIKFCKPCAESRAATG